MKNMLPVVAMSALLIAACGGVDAGEGLDAPVLETLASEVRASQCIYRVEIAVLKTFPPQFQYILHRLPSKHCAEESVVLGTSYISSPPLVAVKGRNLVVAFSYKPTPSGAGSTFLSIQHIDPETLEVVRAETLAAGPGGFSNGVFASRLYFSGHRLVVEGTKNGFIPGEIGSGSRFTAVYPHFLTSDQPPVVFAFDDP